MTSTSSLLLYTASFLSAISIAGHTQMGSETVFPSLDLQVIGDKGKGAGAAKIGWLEGNMVFGIMGILYAKWAVTGINDGYEMGILAFATAYQFACGVGFIRLGVYIPLLALWITPAVAIAGLVVGLPL